MGLKGVTTSATPEHQNFADLMRTAAIVLVVIVHLYGYFGTTADFNGLAIVAVNAFFVLSGFLLSGPYLKAVLKRDGRLPSWRTFASRRFLRIYPLYAVAVVTSAAPFVLAHRHHGVSLADVFAHLTFAHGFFPAYAQSAFNVSLWTMAVDAQFYVILPVAAFVVFAVSRSMSVASRRNLIVGSIIASVALSLVARAIVYKLTSALHDFDIAIVCARNAIGVAGGFALGIAIALARVEGLRPGRAASLGYAILAVLCAAWLVVTGAQESDQYLVHVIYDFVGAVAAAALLFGLGFGNFPRLHKFSGLPAITWAASISYGVYCFHKPFSLLAIHLFTHRTNPESLSYGLAITAFTIGITVPVAMLTYRLIEVPFLAIKASLGSRPLQESPEAGTSVAREALAQSISSA